MTDPTTPDPALFDDDSGDVDESAEMDSSVPSDVADAEPYTPTDDTFTGVCRGGPYDGRRITSRFPDGFLLYDKAGCRVWTYDADPQKPGEFVAVNHGQPTMALSAQALRPVAEGCQYDILAYDPGPAVS